MLIDKSELLKAYDAAHKGPPGGARKLIEEAPAVEAVPLDKLCDWLAEKWDCPPERMTEEGLCKKFNWKCSKCCRQSIEKWMEGLDGGEGLIP